MTSQAGLSGICCEAGRSGGLTYLQDQHLFEVAKRWRLTNCCQLPQFDVGHVLFL